MAPMMEVPYTDEDVEDGVADAYANGKLVDADGEPDPKKLAKAIAMIVLQHKVNKRSERIGGALHRDNLIPQIFPTLIRPIDYKRQANPELAKAIYEAVLRDVGAATSPNAGSPVQRLVNDEGWVLCRIALSGGRTQDGYYVTQDWKCIEEDFNASYRRKALLAGERYGKQMDLLMRTVPALADKAKREYESGMQVALDAGANIFAPALAAAKTDSSNGSEPASGAKASNAGPEPASDSAAA